MYNRTSLYLQAFYLFNPEEDNGVVSRPPNGLPHSIADQYLARGGVNYLVTPKWGLSLSLGGRIEGVPSEDAIGSSDGFRRPGYAVSIEPGVTVAKNQWLVNLSTPVAVYRNRVRSVDDKRRGRHGDAAFADFLVTATISRQF